MDFVAGGAHIEALALELKRRATSFSLQNDTVDTGGKP